MLVYESRKNNYLPIKGLCAGRDSLVFLTPLFSMFLLVQNEVAWHNDPSWIRRVRLGSQQKGDRRMIRPAILVLIVLVGIDGRAPIRAAQFTMDLKAQTAKQDKSAAAKYPSPNPTAQPRAVLMAGVNTAITVTWTVRNSDKTATVKDALVHFFIVKIEKPNQQVVPKLNKQVVAESALTMDFKAQDKTEGEITFTVTQPEPTCCAWKSREPPPRTSRSPLSISSCMTRGWPLK